jgi:ribonuclease VapC
MVVDPSALVAIILLEPEGPRCEATLGKADSAVIGAPSVVEASMVLARTAGADAEEILSKTLRLFEVEVVPFTAEHAAAAHDAFLRYGKGRHPAALNFRDCMAYAIAKVSGMPLLFVGNDFGQTDLPGA